MDFPLIIDAIKDVGFPMVISGYLLFRMERTLGQLRDVLGGLRNSLAVLQQPWNGIERRRPRGAPGTREPWQSPTGTEGR